MLASCPAPAADIFLWIEAERFDDRGGWVGDAQFIDQMGSPYLAGGGKWANPSAMRSIVSRCPGRTPIASGFATAIWLAGITIPGQFTCFINGKRADLVFAGAGKRFPAVECWEDGGVQDLAARSNSASTTLTAYYGRCDPWCCRLIWIGSPPGDKTVLGPSCASNAATRVRRRKDRGALQTWLYSRRAAGWHGRGGRHSPRRQRGADPEPAQPRRKR